MKLEQGKNKFRVLSKPITGWLDRDQTGDKKKPVRTTKKEDALNPGDEFNQPKHFWAMKVWNYKSEAVELLEITQWSVQNSIMNYINTPEYGSPLGYDLEITKAWEKKMTTYSVVAMPPKELSKDIVVLSDKLPVNLEALFDNKNPFEVEAEDDLFV